MREPTARKALPAVAVERRVSGMDTADLSAIRARREEDKRAAAAITQAAIDAIRHALEAIKSAQEALRAEAERQSRDDYDDGECQSLEATLDILSETDEWSAAGLPPRTGMTHEFYGWLL